MSTFYQPNKATTVNFYGSVQFKDPLDQCIMYYIKYEELMCLKSLNSMKQPMQDEIYITPFAIYTQECERLREKKKKRLKETRNKTKTDGAER